MLRLVPLRLETGLQMIHEADLKRLSWKAPDYTKLKEKEFVRALKDINTIEELEGLANRRKWLNNHELKPGPIGNVRQSLTVSGNLRTVDERKLKNQMMNFERKRAKLGLRAALPDDKRKRRWREAC